MSRWDYDVVFYRVFFITLLGVALIFTVILTNFFVNLDDVLSNKKHLPEVEVSTGINKNAFSAPKSIDFMEDQYDSEDPSYRTRRSPDLDNFQNIKNSAYKRALTNRLESLLEELDNEEIPKDETTVKATTVNDTVKGDKNKLEVKNEDLMHLAMHNILLQGIIEHMDLNQVYKKVRELVESFNNDPDKDRKDTEILDIIVNSKEKADTAIANTYNEEHKLFEEIIKCKRLRNEIEQQQQSRNRTDKKLLIKTTIEINEPIEKHQNLNNTQKEFVEGIIKMIYNGKRVKINEMKEEQSSLKPNQNLNDDIEIVTRSLGKSPNDKRKFNAMKHNVGQQKNNLLNTIIEEYLRSHPIMDYKIDENKEFRTYKRKRLKRQIKIKYLNDDPTSVPTIINSNKDDDELFVEIETHYDGRGVLGEKKKKIIKSLITKIQKALGTDNETNAKKTGDLKFTKRFQDPIDLKNQSMVMKRIMPSLEGIEMRQVDPIEKTLERHEYMLNRFGDSWKTKIHSPRFLSVSKSINSAELRELNINYDSVLGNEIAQRSQKPLQDDTLIDNVTSNVDNATVFLKDIDGTGFSIGISRYVAEQPDQDSMKMFNGLESLIREYRRPYSHNDVSEFNIREDNNLIGDRHEINKRDVNELTGQASLAETRPKLNLSLNRLIKKSISPLDIIGFKQAQVNIINNKKSLNSIFYNLYMKNTNILSNNINLKVPFLIKDIADHKMKSLSVLTEKKNRTKRSLSVKKISNIKSKIKLSRYINTNSMSKKKIFLKNKRNKRQIDKIRIIARDPAIVASRDSDENIFLMSKENIYSDIREPENPIVLINNKDEKRYDETLPFKEAYRIQHEDVHPIYSSILYNTKQRQSRLMSKYPHLFVDQHVRSVEETTDDFSSPVNEQNYRILLKSNNEKFKKETKSGALSDISEPKIDEIFDAIMPPASQSKYKITVKLTPKNTTTTTNVDGGFKEIHTSVNKSFDENGLRYFSLFNVSQISKIEKLNESSVVIRRSTLKPPKEQLNHQKRLKTLLELHKKRVDEELRNLLKESQHLRQMIESSNENNSQIKTINISHNKFKTDNDDKLNKVLESIKKLEDTYNLAKSKSSVEKIHTKSEIVDIIRSNERNTKEVLKKIDLNTNVLRALLQHFQEKIRLNRFISSKENTSKVSDNKEAYTEIGQKYTHIEDKNNTDSKHTYKYEVPKKPVPSNEYNNIKTNIIQNSEMAEDLKKNAGKMVNESKFFIDDFEGDYKVVPDKTYSDLNSNVNTTKV